MTSATTGLKFKVTGMDCASCARKIETAVKRIPGASDMQVGLNSEMLSVKLIDTSKKSEIESAVNGLGYGIAPASGSKAAEVADRAAKDDHTCFGDDHSGHAHDHPTEARPRHDHKRAPADHAGKVHDHADHAGPIEGAWWQSPKGRLVIFTGILLAVAFAYSRLLPYGGQLLFAAACVAGAIPVVRRAFDKTGTLTEGKPKVTDIVPLSDMDERSILSMAASAEVASSHPLAVAILNHAKEEKVAFTAACDSEVILGKGIRAAVDGRSVTIGAPGRLGIQSAEVLDKAYALEKQGKSVSVLQIDRKPVGLIALRDEPRPDAADALNQIKGLGIKPVILTGDDRANAEAIAALLGVDVKAELLPEDKLRHIKSSAEQGCIAKVGDGVNDAPALAAATVGIAMGSGTDVALEAADAAVLNNRIVDVVRLVKLSRQTMNVIRQNVTIALGLKVVFLVTTVLRMTRLWIAILADTGATVPVTANALRLLRR